MTRHIRSSTGRWRSTPTAMLSRGWRSGWTPAASGGRLPWSDSRRFRAALGEINVEPNPETLSLVRSLKSCDQLLTGDG